MGLVRLEYGDWVDRRAGGVEQPQRVDGQHELPAAALLDMPAYWLGITALLASLPHIEDAALVE